MNTFASLIYTQTKKKCGEVAKTAAQPAPALDLGVSVRDDDGKGETKIFNRNLGPNLFFQRDF